MKKGNHGDIEWKLYKTAESYPGHLYTHDVNNTTQYVTNMTQYVTNVIQDATNIPQDVTNIKQDVTNIHRVLHI